MLREGSGLAAEFGADVIEAGRSATGSGLAVTGEFPTPPGAPGWATAEVGSARFGKTGEEVFTTRELTGGRGTTRTGKLLPGSVATGFCFGSCGTEGCGTALTGVEPGASFALASFVGCALIGSAATGLAATGVGVGLATIGATGLAGTARPAGDSEVTTCFCGPDGVIFGAEAPDDVAPAEAEPLAAIGAFTGTFPLPGSAGTGFVATLVVALPGVGSVAVAVDPTA